MTPPLQFHPALLLLVCSFALLIPSATSQSTAPPRDGFNQVVFRMAYDEPFGIACIGAFNQYHGAPGTNVARLTAYGAREPQFAIPSTLPVFKGTIAVVHHHAFAGFTSPTPLPNTTNILAGLMRLDPSGQPTGNPPFLPLPSEPLEVIPSPDGSLYTSANNPDYAGSSPDNLFSRGPLIRFAPDGSRDFSFQIHATTPTRPRLAFNETGSSFWISGGPRFRVYTEPLTLAKHLPASGIDNPVATQLAHFQTNGTPIPSPPLTLAYSPPHQPNTTRPSILTVSRISPSFYAVGGQFTHVNAHPLSGLFRMNEQGEIDPSWNPHLSTIPNFLHHISEIIPSTPGACLALLHLSGDTVRALVQIQPNGQIDTNFGIHRFTLNSPSVGITLVRTSPGMIFAAGDFRAVNGLPRQRFARFHPDGTLGADADLTLVSRPPTPSSPSWKLFLDSRQNTAAQLESSPNLFTWDRHPVEVQPGLILLESLIPPPPPSQRFFRFLIP